MQPVNLFAEEGGEQAEYESVCLFGGGGGEGRAERVC